MNITWMKATFLLNVVPAFSAHGIHFKLSKKLFRTFKSVINLGREYDRNICKKFVLYIAGIGGMLLQMILLSSLSS
jgi:hypothetical protein